MHPLIMMIKSPQLGKSPQLDKSTGKTLATINLDALRHNLSRVRELAPNSKVLSVIKANAYGHGVLPTAQALISSDAFAVARLDEAILLREGLDDISHDSSSNNSVVTKPIIILEGVFYADDYHKCIELKLIPVVHSLEQFQWLQECENCHIDYWLKLDTGMHRLGFSDDELTWLIEQYQQKDDSVSQLPSAIMSHFACADEVSNPANQNQITQFNQKYRLLSVHKNITDTMRSMSNSAAILSIPKAHYDWVRPGIMLYGISPFETANPSRNGLDENLKPVMTLTSELISIKKLKKGDCIGYGASWCCPEDMTVGVVAIGYGDGYPRHAPSGTPVLIHNMEVPLVGRVSMDMITVDLRCLEKKLIPFQVGDQVVLWGDGLPIEKVSHKAGTIAYELLCQITQRVRMTYIDSTE
ncbi:MAG: alanine racemase [Gammaproteobacteria bacterium]|nr:alanine racemase [Gammaproteobacteria bacterium]